MQEPIQSWQHQAFEEAIAQQQAIALVEELVERSAVRLQCALRARLAREERQWRRKVRQLQVLCASAEWRAVVTIQRLWRWLQDNRASLKIQSAFRAHQEHQRLEQERLEQMRQEQLRREEEERLERERLERLRREKTERLERERLERLRREEEERLELERQEQLRREQEEQLERERLERLRRKEEEQLHRERQERLRREHEEQLERERLERLRREEEEERLHQERLERLRREEEERQEQQRAAREEARRAAAAAAAAEGAQSPRSPNRQIRDRRDLGLVHKETGFRSFGRFEVVRWRQRYAFTTPEALCYQHVRSTRHLQRAPSSSNSTTLAATAQKEPHGKITRIAFDTIRRIGVEADDPHVLVLQCFEREYFFRFSSAPHCEEWAAVLCAAAAQAGTCDEEQAAGIERELVFDE